jgi:putative transposase
VTYYVLFFVHLDSRRVSIARITDHPESYWMEQIARSATLEGWGFLQSRRYLLHDRDGKFSESFRDTLAAGGVKPLKLPARSPNLNAFAERWVRSVKEECLAKLVLFGEASPRRALKEYVANFHAERNHQGKGNVLLFPSADRASGNGSGRVSCQERLWGLLKYYHREAA